MSEIPDANTLPPVVGTTKSGSIATLIETMVEAVVEREVAAIATLSAALQVATPPDSVRHNEADLEADLDKMPI